MRVTLELSDELAELLREVEPQDDRAVLVETVCGLYARGRIGGGRAAKMLGVDRLQFQHELAKREIPLNYNLEELKHDLAFARGQ